MQAIILDIEIKVGRVAERETRIQERIDDSLPSSTRCPFDPLANSLDI
jgi:hypothetical protein